MAFINILPFEIGIKKASETMVRGLQITKKQCFVFLWSLLGLNQRLPDYE